jgi:hypothetical protein
VSWVADPKRDSARNEHGYKITWAQNKHGTWFNGWSPRGTHIDAGYDKEIVKAMCEMHREKLEKQRAMYQAKKHSKEIHVEPAA